jgi:hypothetical protein
LVLEGGKGWLYDRAGWRFQKNACGWAAQRHSWALEFSQDLSQVADSVKRTIPPKAIIVEVFEYRKENGGVLTRRALEKLV